MAGAFSVQRNNAIKRKPGMFAGHWNEQARMHVLVN
jgi:hypothetical protein